MEEIPVRFENEKQTLVGMMHLPEARPPYPCAVFLHSYTGNRIGEHRLLVKAARDLAEGGIACLRFDFRGSGESEGDFADVTLETELSDARAAIKFLSDFKGIDPERIGLVGIGYGASVAACISADNEVNSLALWSTSAFVDFLVESGGEVAKDPYAWLPPSFKDAVKKRGKVDIGGFLRGKGFFESIKALDPIRDIARYGGPVLLIHGSEDQVISPVNSELMYDNVRGQRRLIIIDDADHTFSSVNWERQVIDATRAWFEETL
jgi:fermentation-respiration switch protein FrsA (DUF1100 family)